MGCIAVSLSCQDVNDKVRGMTSFSKSIPEMIRSHDFPFYPGAKSIATGREVSALASKLLVREIEAHCSTRRCHESWLQHIGCTIHQDDNREG